jgi:hypothetical protein
MLNRIQGIRHGTRRRAGHPVPSTPCLRHASKGVDARPSPSMTCWITQRSFRTERPVRIRSAACAFNDLSSRTGSETSRTHLENIPETKMSRVSVVRAPTNTIGMCDMGSDCTSFAVVKKIRAATISDARKSRPTHCPATTVSRRDLSRSGFPAFPPVSEKNALFQRLKPLLSSLPLGHGARSTAG